MPDLNDPFQKNPHHPFRDHWHKQQHQNETTPGPMHDALREHHDHLSALTWSDDEPKKKGTRND
jgi:hypothetical protein